MGTCLSHFDYWFLKFLICFCFFIFFCAFVRWYYSQSANSYIQSDFTLLYEIGVGSIIIQLISRVYTAGSFEIVHTFWSSCGTPKIKLSSSVSLRDVLFYIFSSINIFSVSPNIFVVVQLTCTLSMFADVIVNHRQSLAMFL